MPDRPSVLVSSEQTGPDLSAASARVSLLDLDRDRPKRIDRYIDYFGGDRGGDGRVDQSPIGGGTPSP